MSTNDKCPELVESNAVLRRMYEERAAAEAKGIVSPTPEPRDLSLLFNLVETKKLTSTLEIGMAHGASTVAICEAHRQNGDGRHTAIDPYQSRDYSGQGVRNIAESGLTDFLELHEGFSNDVLPKLLKDGRKYDFVFIDGNHVFDFVFVDFFFSDLLLNDGGYILFHDANLPAVRKVISYVLRNRAYQISLECSEETVRLGIGFRKLLYNIMATPWEPMLWGTWGSTPNYRCCLLRKLGKLEIAWDEYHSF